MKTDICKDSGPGLLLDQLMPVMGEIRVRVHRADGRVEEKLLKNVVTRAGLNRIANRATNPTATSSAFAYIGVGTQVAVHSLDSAQVGVGEMLRKITNFAGAGQGQSREWIFLQATIGGASDAMTGFLLDTVFMTDFQNSHASTGIIAGVTNGMGVTLAASDLLDLTYRFRVGSHNLSHSS